MSQRHPDQSLNQRTHTWEARKKAETASVSISSNLPFYVVSPHDQYFSFSADSGINRSDFTETSGNICSYMKCESKRPGERRKRKCESWGQQAGLGKEHSWNFSFSFPADSHPNKSLSAEHQISFWSHNGASNRPQPSEPSHLPFLKYSKPSLFCFLHFSPTSNKHLQLSVFLCRAKLLIQSHIMDILPC